MLERKALSIELKADAQGQFRAIFATFNVVDKDGDVTLPGAFKAGQEVRIAQWGHNWGALPVGKGVINADQERAWVDGEFFLDTTPGKDTYTTVKGLGALQEWSYGFDVLGYEFGKHGNEDVRFLKAMDVHEVSPVMLGAGIGTGTESIKGSFDEEAERFVSLYADFVARAKARAGVRGKSGRSLSAANREMLSRHLEAVSAIHADLEKLLAETDPGAEPKALRAEWLRFERIRAQQMGVAI